MSKNMWFIGDCHIKHNNILHLGKGRPFKTIEEMEEALVTNINKLVREQDTLIFLGDTCFGSDKDTRDFLNKINCKTKIEVIGNHSKNGLKHFTLATYALRLKIAGQKVNLSHYPYRYKWLRRLFNKPLRQEINRLEDDGRWLIHGHTHSSIKTKRNMINVCVDAWNYKPVSKQQIEQIIQQQEEKIKKLKPLAKLKLKLYNIFGW